MSPRATGQARKSRDAEVDQAVARGIRGWLSFTLAHDTARSFLRLPHTLTNWLTIVALAAAWWHWGLQHWQLLTAIMLGCLIYSIGRAARHLRGHRRTTQGLLEATQSSCKHRRPTRSKPVRAEDRVRITRWAGPTHPKAGSISYSANSAAASPSTRGVAEQAISKAVPRSQDQAVVYSHDTPGEINFAVVADDDPRVAQSKTSSWITQTLSTLFPKSRNDLTIDVDWTETVQPGAPGVITVEYGANEAVDRLFRDTVERQFDDRVNRGIEWLYDWSTPGTLTIAGDDKDSPAAQRKRAQRKVADVLIGAVTRAGGRTAGKQTTVEVTGWIPEDAPTSANTPLAVAVGFGTADFSEVATRHRLTDHIDQALENEWPDRVWIADWSFGHAGQITLQAVPTDHAQALRKTETKRFRQIATTTFPKDSTPDVTVNQWNSGPGSERPQDLVVHYGTANLTDPEKRLEFETHLDTYSTRNGWRYEWDETPGELHITAVPKLPTYLPFPSPGTPEFDRWHTLFRQGEIWVGPAKGGYETIIKLNKTPHTLIGGATGAGKSYLAGLILYGALMNPDLYELIVIDPKLTDWTWTEHYPNVVTFAPTDVRRRHEQINEAITEAHDSMMDVQTLLKQHGCRTVEQLRARARDGQIDIPEADVPRRLLIFFDEGGAAFEPIKNDEDAKAHQDASRSSMDQIGMLGRAMEHNIVMCAQKPSDKNIGTSMRSQLANKLGIGHLDHNTSMQVMDSTLCTRLPFGSPPGRGWFVNDEGKQLLTQTFFLPNEDQPDPLDPTVTLRGIREQVAERLTSLGYVPIKRQRTMTKQDRDGSPVEISFTQTEWVRAEALDTPGDATGHDSTADQMEDDLA